MRPTDFLQSAEERRGWFVHAAAHVKMVAREVFVTVPIAPRKTVVRAAPDLNKTHAAFEQPSRSQAASSEILRDGFVKAVKFPGRLGFSGNVEHFRRAELKLCRQFIGSDAGVEPRIAFTRGLVLAIHFLKQRQTFFFAFGCDVPGRLGRKQIENRIGFADPNHRPLMCCGEET